MSGPHRRGDEDHLVTPPETQDGRGTDQTQEVEKPSTVKTVNRSEPAEKPEQESNGQGGSAEKTVAFQPAVVAAAAAAPAAPEADEAGAPPPWQRVTSDARFAEEEVAQEEPAAEAAAADSADAGDMARPRLVDEQTVSVPRPVVTGTAAPRALGEYPPVGLYQTGPQPAMGQPARTTVNLGGSPIPGVDGGGRAGQAPPSALRRPGRGPRRANLQIKRFDPWSVLKLSLVLGVALFFVWLVAVGVLYAVLDGMGVWDKVNGTANELFSSSSGGTAEPLVSAGRVFGIAAIIGAVNIVLFSALATVGAFVYNVSADLAGGLEVTLAERE
jgi:hypothetical protein